ncbi:MAG: hypothetical protein KGI25_01860 [Thaumarchaeota archaeon]|nr:hypothetical protein [Nitrososphaerota archaeon]
MNHSYYFDGNQKKISWTIETNGSRADQVRTHIEDYYEKMSVEQSKYVALHVGIFWGIGRFIIKNGDTVNIMLDLRSMFDHLVENKIQNDPFVINRSKFIQQLIDQRRLQIKYQIIDPQDNKANKLLS